MKCCEAVKRSCAEKLVLYLIIIMTNIKLFLVYKDQRSPEKKPETEFPVQMGKILSQSANLQYGLQLL